MSAPEHSTNSSPFDLPAPLWLKFWTTATLLFGILFYLSFCFEHQILDLGGTIWTFFRNIFRYWDII